MHTTGKTHALVKVFETNNKKNNILHNTKYLSCIKKTSQGLELLKKKKRSKDRWWWCTMVITPLTGNQK